MNYARPVAAAILLALPPFTSRVIAQDALPPSSRRSFEPKKTQLSPAGSPGRFVCSSTRSVGFAAEAAYPVKVSIVAGGKLVASVLVSDGNPFTLEAALPPGAYMLYSEPVSAQAKVRYWGVYDAEFRIDDEGILTERNGGSPTLIHLQKMELIAPAMTEEISDLRPTLRWKPLAEARSYGVSWLESLSPDRNPTGRGSGRSLTPEFTFTEEVKPKTRYEWSVRAYDQAGQEIGYYSSGYFSTPGADPRFRQEWAIPAGGSRLGITPTIRGEIPAGIEISAVAPDSPASRAELKPGDVLTNFHGTGLSEMSISAFVRMVRASEPNRPVEVEFIRDGKRHSATVTLEAGGVK